MTYLPGGSSDFDRVQAWALAHLREVVKTFGGVEPNRAGRCRCPIHGGDGLSLSVADGKGWRCHSACGAGGDGVDFVRRMKFDALPEKEGRIAALRELAPMAGVVLRESAGHSSPLRHFAPPRQVPRPPTVTARPVEPSRVDPLRTDGLVPQERRAVYDALLDATTLTARGRAYMAGRGFDPDDVAAYGFRSVDGPEDVARLGAMLADSFMPEELADAGLWNLERGAFSVPFVPSRWATGALIIPYLDRSGQGAETVRFRNLDPHSDERYRSLRGDVPVPFNWGAAFLAKGGELHVTEGELNALSLVAAGVLAIGLPGANTWRPEWAAPIRRASRLVAWFDDDKGGRRGVTRLATILQAELGRSWLSTHSAAPQILTDDLNTLHQRGTLHARLDAVT